MEITCNRCHQAIQADNCFCPTCGLPQLVYAPDTPDNQTPADRWTGAAHDASMVDWKPAMRAALILAIPAGLLSSGLSPLGFFGLFWMAAAAAWAVALYMRGQHPAWITIGAGARIGLVTGILGSWAAALTTAISLYAMRFWLHRGPALDADWLSQLNLATQYWGSMGFSAQQIALNRAIMLSPEGHAGFVLSSVGFLAAILLAFSVAGGALGARFLGRPRRIEQ